MNKSISWLITDNNITVNFEGQTHIVPRTDALGDRLIKAIKEKRMEEIPNLISVSKRIETFSNGNFVVKDGSIFVNGVQAPSVLGNKILKFSNEGLPFQPLVKFAEKLQKNPSFRAVNELFQFLEKNDHPITENGNFIAYKKVRPDFKDIHSGTFDNSPGTVVEMPRNQVNENPNQTCSYGLHVANWDYAANHFGSNSDVMLEVEVDPSDVVSVPVDYNQSKMRVCKYKVLGVVNREHSQDLSLRVTGNKSVEELRNDESDSDDNDDMYCKECGYKLCDDYYEYCEFCRDDMNDDYPWDEEL